MKSNPQNAREEPGIVLGSRSIYLSERLALASLILCMTVAIPFFKEVNASAVTNQPTAEQYSSSLESVSLAAAPDYSNFSHKHPAAHEDFAKPEKCGSCHRRKDGSLEPRFPAHKDCIGCHLVEFTAFNSASSGNPICTNCHKAEGLNSPNAPLKSFPRLISFKAEFDHAQHLKGIESARPGKGCAACHVPANRGVALSIPSRLKAHQVCYECHSAGKSASSFSSCGSCHKFGSYSPTSIAARSYRVGFSHADHSAGRGLNCESCHNVLSRGLAQRRQVSSISPLLHHSTPRSRSCMTCHNGKRAFGDARAEFNDCKRCHKGVTFKS
jgi:c(7)-type cytochrome triheme protein